LTGPLVLWTLSCIKRSEEVLQFPNLVKGGFVVKRQHTLGLCGLLLGLAATVAAQAPVKPGKGVPFGQYPQAKPAVGELAPDFTLHDLDGKALRLKDLLGKRPVVLEFGSYT
jgi:cytochrome oxidase Cu insertion factor (SCO1/SenC/PrrC family)